MTPPQLLMRPVAVTALLALVSCAATAQATIVASYSGNTRAKAENPPHQDATVNYAVFERGGTPGDTFGTGLANFDSLFTPGVSPHMFDISAQYLYLYQNVNDGSNGNTLFQFGLTVGEITSLGVWPRVLADDGGVINGSNPFGRNTTDFLKAAPANLGVNGGRVSGTQPHIVPNSNSMSYNDTEIGATFNLAANQTLALIGFTSNRPPALVRNTLETCADDFACGSYVAPDPAFFKVDPTATYLRAADEETLPAPATIIHLPTAIPGQPIAPGDWLLLQRVGDFAFTNAQDPFSLPPNLQGPHASDGRPGTLRNMYGIFSGSSTLRSDPEALTGAKTVPIPTNDPLFSRVPQAKLLMEGNAALLDSDDPSRFNRTGTQRGDAFVASGMTKYQLTNISGDFYIDLEGDLEFPTPVLVRVPTGATHLFVGAGDGQFFDNHLTDSDTYDDGRITGLFGFRLAVVSPNRMTGDYNQDGFVNAADYVVWRNRLGQMGIDQPADGNLDGVVNLADFQLWKANYGESVAASATSFNLESVPEPAPISLIAAALLCGRLVRGIHRAGQGAGRVTELGRRSKIGPRRPNIS
jgi:hypothetical protein